MSQAPISGFYTNDTDSKHINIIVILPYRKEEKLWSLEGDNQIQP